MEVICPRCKKATIYEGNLYRPFCSERCKIIDLGNWASEKYAVPTQESAEDSVKDQSQQDSDNQNFSKPKEEE